jgi:Na+-driven multidrug efflux pump
VVTQGSGFLLIFVLLESAICLTMGVIKGLGLQSMASLWILISYLFLGLPLAAFFSLEAFELFKWQGQDSWLKKVHGFSGIYLGMDIALTILLIQLL